MKMVTKILLHCYCYQLSKTSFKRTKTNLRTEEAFMKQLYFKYKNSYIFIKSKVLVNPIYDSRGPKCSLPNFLLKLLQTLKLAPKTFWLSVLTLSPQWGKSSRQYIVPVPNYWTLTKTRIQKVVFWSNP